MMTVKRSPYNGMWYVSSELGYLRDDRATALNMGPYGGTYFITLEEAKAAANEFNIRGYNVKPEYSDGNWHGWNGGECPVHADVLVDVMWREEDGTYLGQDGTYASTIDWKGIDAFRVSPTGDEYDGDEYEVKFGDAVSYCRSIVMDVAREQDIDPKDLVASLLEVMEEKYE